MFYAAGLRAPREMRESGMQECQGDALGFQANLLARVSGRLGEARPHTQNWALSLGSAG